MSEESSTPAAGGESKATPSDTTGIRAIKRPPGPLQLGTPEQEAALRWLKAYKKAHPKEWDDLGIKQTQEMAAAKARKP